MFVTQRNNDDMLPKSLCIIDDDREYTEFLGQYLKEQGISTTHYLDSNEALAAEGVFDHDFYLVDLMLPGIDGLDVIRLLRRRTDSGVVVISGRMGDQVFDEALTAGADMYLAKPVRFEQILLAVKAVERRAIARAQSADTWRLDSKAMLLSTPKKITVRLSETDLVLMRCFLEAEGEIVSQATIFERLGKEQTADTDNWLHATVYRLRRRLEQATDEPVPLQSRPRAGYIFRAKLSSV
jgi:two-component system, OmpR family, response regulator